ncbi:MAG: flagellar assembly lytic transglycosylase [Treponemataceae bacterium]
MKNLFLIILTFFSLSVFSKGSSEPLSNYNQSLTEAMDKKDYEKLQSFLHEKRYESELNPDLAYFLGLHFVEMDELRMAQKLFDFGWKKASPILAKLCGEKSIEIASENEKLAVIEKYISLYPADYEGKLLLARHYYEKKNYRQVLKVVGIPNLTTFETPPESLHTDTSKRQKQIAEQLAAENEFAFFRILALIHLENPSFLKFLEAWVVNWKITQHHRDFLKIWLELPNRSDLVRHYGNQLSQIIYILQMRNAVFTREHSIANGYAEKIELTQKLYSPNFFSDYCRAQFFAYKNLPQFREKLLALIKKTQNRTILFRSNFYIARIYAREKQYTQAMDHFRKAMDSAPNPENYDNALWYYFDTASKVSIDSVISALYAFGKTINSTSYFEDFFSSLSLSLLSAKNWNAYIRVYETMTTLSGSGSISQFAYLSARLLEEGYAQSTLSGRNLQQKITAAYKQAYDSDHSSLYYRVLAAKKLNAPIEQISQTFYNRTKNHQFIQNDQLEYLCMGYARYGFPEKVYATFLTDYNSISLPVALELSHLLYDKGLTNSRLYSDSLRIISLATSRVEVPLTTEILKALYPRPYYDEVRKATKQFDISEYVFYGLIRTESFFHKDVSSHAGAIGLAQLMPSTAADIARRLKITEYDLLNAETNTLFGAYYYSEMVQRMNNSQLLALFSYNGGPTRVRSWVRANNSLPLDIFLEIVPIFETRDYGRKVLAASILYGYLYYNMSSNDIIDELMHKPASQN